MLGLLPLSINVSDAEGKLTPMPAFRKAPSVYWLRYKRQMGGHYHVSGTTLHAKYYNIYMST